VLNFYTFFIPIRSFLPKSLRRFPYSAWVNFFYGYPMDLIYFGALCVFAACPALLAVVCSRLGGEA
jgi:hypothetical protein